MFLRISENERGSIQEKHSMRQDLLGINIGHHCVDKIIRLTGGLSRFMVVDVGGG